MPTTPKRVATPTPKQLLLEHRYDGDLAAYVKACAASGLWSWREIADDVSQQCSHAVSYESLRQWYGSAAAKRAAQDYGFGDKFLDRISTQDYG